MIACDYGISMVSSMELSVNDITKRETFMVQKIPQELVKRVRTHRGSSTNTKKWVRGKNWHGEAFPSYQFGTVNLEEMDE